MPVKDAEIAGLGELWHCLEFTKLKLNIIHGSVDFHFSAVVKTSVLFTQVAVGENIALFESEATVSIPSGLADPVRP